MLRRHCTICLNRLNEWRRTIRHRHREKAECVQPHWQLSTRPPLDQLARMPRHLLPSFVQESSIACHDLTWLGILDWSNYPERQPQQEDGMSWRGPEPQASAPYVAAFLVKVDRQLPHMSDLRQWLIEHPALPWLFGFPLQPSAVYPWGFDVDASLPSHRHFNRVLRKLPNAPLQFLLSSSIERLTTLLPPETLIGDEISLDTKHIIAWVMENNPKVFHEGARFDKTQQPKGDPDCKVGFKAYTNQVKATPAPTTDGMPGSRARVGEYYWGYASGIVATKIPAWGEIVLAEKTLPLDHGDLSYFLPLMRQVEGRLGRRPRFGALDAAFDAFYVYAYFHHAGGFAAVPMRNPKEMRCFDAHGLPLCAANLPMPLKGTYTDKTHLLHHRRGRYACPLYYPQSTGKACPIHHHHSSQQGCLTTMATSIGARLHYTIDRKSVAYQRLYRQRTATERIFSQAFALGIERPKLRNGWSIANLNTCIYLTINLRTYQRIQQQQATTP